MNLLTILRQCGRNLGPYLMIEILLPGGTLLALLLLLHREGKLSGVTNASRIVVAHLRAASDAVRKFAVICGEKYHPLARPRTRNSY